MYHDPK